MSRGIVPKKLEDVDQRLLSAVREVMRGQRTAISNLTICERLAARGAIKMTEEVRLNRDHPTQLAVADCVLALHGARELDGLMNA